MSLKINFTEYGWKHGRKLKGTLVKWLKPLLLSQSQVYHLALQLTIQLARRLKSLPGNQLQSHVLLLEKTNSTAYLQGPTAAKHTLHAVEHLCIDANEYTQEEELVCIQQHCLHNKEVRDPKWS